MSTGSPEPGNRRRRRVLARLLLIGAAVVAAAIAVELLLPEPAQLRAAIWRQARGSIEEHRPGRLQPKAGFVGEQTVGGRVQRIRHNSLGMRGPELAAKAAGERRVLFLGDSVTYGTGVQEEETFAYLAAARLTAALGSKVTTGIAACPGFGIRDQVDLLRRVQADFAPDLIVSCVFVENDLYDDLQLERGVFAGYPVFQAAQVRLLRRSWRARLAVRCKSAFLIEQLLTEYVPALAIDLGGAALAAEEAALWEGVAPDQSVLFLEQAEATPAISRLLQRARAALAELRAAATGTPIVVVVLPSYVQYVPGLFEHLAAQRPAEQRHVRGTVQQRLRQLCDELGLPVHDLLPPLLARQDVRSLLIERDYHFTPAGHAVVADLLAPALAAALRR